MQPDTITLPVDPANDATVVNEIFSRYDEYADRSLYIGPAHLPESRNTMGFYRTSPKPSGNFKGVQKTSVKLTRDISVTGVDGVSSITSPIIIQVSFSFPVGAPAADFVSSRQCVLALMDYDLIMDNLNRIQMI